MAAIPFCSPGADTSLQGCRELGRYWQLQLLHQRMFFCRAVKSLRLYNDPFGETELCVELAFVDGEIESIGISPDRPKIVSKALCYEGVVHETSDLISTRLTRQRNNPYRESLTMWQPQSAAFLTSRDLVRQRLDYVQIGRSRDHLIETENPRDATWAIFLHRALSSTNQDEHCNVTELFHGRQIALLARPTPQAGARRLLESRVDNLETVATGANLVQLLRQQYEPCRTKPFRHRAAATEVLEYVA